jgi:hypothetical protein
MDATRRAITPFFPPPIQSYLRKRNSASEKLPDGRTADVKMKKRSTTVLMYMKFSLCRRDFVVFPQVIGMVRQLYIVGKLTVNYGRVSNVSVETTEYVHEIYRV